MRLNTSRASLSPPNRNTLCDAGSIAPGSASFMIGDLAKRIERRDLRGEDRREQPEEADRHADDADAAVEQLAVEAEPLLVQ